MHAAVGEQGFGGFPGAAESFEQEDGFGKFLLHAGDDVLPGRHGNFVAGIAAEAVHAAAAPGQEHVGELVPERDVVVFQFDEVLPGDAPGAGTGKRAVGFAQEPFGMIFLQAPIPSRCG